jgi:hypothetical protein
VVKEGQHELRLWDVATGALFSFKGKDHYGALAFSRNGKRILIGNLDGTATIWLLAEVLTRARQGKH